MDGDTPMPVIAHPKPVTPTSARQRQMSIADVEFKDTTKKDTLHTLEDELQRLLATAKDEDNEDPPTINWSKISPLPDHAIRSYTSLPFPAPDRIKSLLNKLVVVKLNGGLGTSMGCKGPKSLISVRNDLTFLDLTLQQIMDINTKYGVSVPLVLMNSFNTDDDTRKILPKYRGLNVRVESFNQSRYPRINRESYAPIAKSLSSHDLEPWFPPGHGDFYEAFKNSGLMDQFIKEGREYVFISNIDNLGSTVDLSILNFLLADERGVGLSPEFLMEVTDKTRADIKVCRVLTCCKLDVQGGTLIEYENKMRLLEIAQVPKDNVDEFKSVSKFRIFNTNNLWVKLSAMKRVLDQGAMDMEIIVNPKNLDHGVVVIQLETAAGAAIKNFNNPCAINVPRSRFLPVKKTQDLLLLMSNLYDIQTGTLTLSRRRQFATTPLVKLGTQYDRVQDFLRRFDGIPDLIDLDHLTVSGDVWFGNRVTLKGTVIIIANHGERIDIPPGAVLENKIVSGNLRILDH